MSYNENVFYNKISSYSNFKNETFNFPNVKLNIDNRGALRGKVIQFDNCSFICDEINFENLDDEELMIFFDNCTFECNVYFSNCKFNELSFRNTKSLKSLIIKKGNYDNSKFELSDFDFSNDNPNEENKLKTDFHINNISVKNRFTFQNVNHVEGIFSFVENSIGNDLLDSSHSRIFSFENSHIFNAYFYKNLFNDYLNFKNISFDYNPEYLKSINAIFIHTKFEKNTFRKVNFNFSEFHKKIEFYNCDFLNTTWYEKCKNLGDSNLNFIACEFKGYVLFNRSTLKFLNIDRCTFDKSVSFTEAFFIKIKLFEVKFNGGAYFDEMRINNVENKSYLKDKDILDWKRTLRAIKQELQKTENKIDFNRFRAYELAAHYQELNYKDNFKDVAILWATKITTDFGINWKKALWFTVKWGFVIYLIFYSYENYNYKLDLSNLENWSQFLSGFFRFLLVTDFYNPLVNDRVYLTNPLSWLIFIIGKIVIAFGIYEMIQSFRKFKA